MWNYVHLYRAMM